VIRLSDAIAPCRECGVKGELRKQLSSYAVFCATDSCRVLRGAWEILPSEAVRAWNEPPPVITPPRGLGHRE
jgi:hypothetical protein